MSTAEDCDVCKSCELHPVDESSDICEDCAWDIHSQLDGWAPDDEDSP